MISPAFSMTRKSPRRMSFLTISPTLWSEAWTTVVPLSTTGFIVARGVSRPVRPTCQSTWSSSVVPCSAAYLKAMHHRGDLEVLPSFSCWARLSTFTTTPSHQ